MWGYGYGYGYGSNPYQQSEVIPKQEKDAAADDDNDGAVVPGSRVNFSGSILQSNHNGRDTTTTKWRSSSICDRCYAMTGTRGGLDALSYYPPGFKHSTLQELRRSADKACRTCRYILESLPLQLTQSGPGGPPDESKTLIVATATRMASTSSSDSDSLLALEIQPINSTSAPWLTRKVYYPVMNYSHFSIMAAESDCAAPHVVGRLPSKKLTPSLVAGIREKFDDCLKAHESCPRSRLPTLPRRVLDLEPRLKEEERETGKSIRLYAPQSELNVRAEYAALSYCWGVKRQPLITTRDNLADHLAAVPEDQIPKTISDAIEVCVKLGIRYLWIDALCIVQDDDEDKLGEIANMGNIYQNATITIVAASAEKVSDGFLESIDDCEEGDNDKLLAGLGCELPLYTGESTAVGTIKIANQHDAYRHTSHEPLFGRAWAHQEYLLSPRALVFESRQVWYKCRTSGLKAVQTTYLKLDSQLESLPASVFGISLPNEGDKENDRQTRKSIWSSIIREYSGRRITYFGDRLFALAGVAEALNKVWKDDVYLAGLWAKTLPEQLGWSAEGEEIIADTEGSPGYASVPSWSWTTVPRQLYMYTAENPDVKLIGYDFELFSPDSPYGPVKRALITLEVRTLRSSDLKLVSWKKPKTSSSSKGDDGDDLPPYPDHGGYLPDLGKCTFVYLGVWGTAYVLFLVIEKSSTGANFRRVGLSLRRYSDWERLEKLLSTVEREIIVLE